MHCPTCHLQAWLSFFDMTSWRKRIEKKSWLCQFHQGIDAGARAPNHGELTIDDRGKKPPEAEQMLRTVFSWGRKIILNLLSYLGSCVHSAHDVPDSSRHRSQPNVPGFLAQYWSTVTLNMHAWHSAVFAVQHVDEHLGEALFPQDWSG